MVKEIDAKDDKIAKLTQELKTLKAQMEQHGNKYKSAQQDGRKAMEQVTELNRWATRIEKNANSPIFVYSYNQNLIFDEIYKNYIGDLEQLKQPKIVLFRSINFSMAMAC